jgi:transformation/transcription domain-associated protein
MDLANCQVYANRLTDESVENSVKLAVVTELKDAIEIVQSQDYAKYLAFIIPAFRAVLSLAEPVFKNTEINHKLRQNVLEILHRLPQTEALRPYATDLMESLLDVLKTDNEENASIALKVIVDLHKYFKSLVEDYVQPFFDFIQECYKNMPLATEKMFSADYMVIYIFL